MKSTNRNLTWDTINCIAILMMVDGYGDSFLSIFLLDSINSVYWFILYTLFGLILPFVYLRTEQAIWKYCNNK